MPRELTEEDYIKIAEYTVKHWEGIPETVAKFRNEFRASDAAIEAMEKSLRQLAGGEKMYNLCKAALKERGLL